MVAAVHSLSHVQLFATSWTAERQASLSFTISRSLHKFMSIESVHFLFIVFNKLIEEALGLGEGCFGGGWLSCWKDHDGLPSVNLV